MAREKKTMEMAQTMARTDNLTNTNNKKSDINTKEGKKSKRHKKLMEDNIEPTYESNHSPTTPQGVDLYGNTLPFFISFLAKKTLCGNIEAINRAH